jgi:hypothetical protein
VFEQLSTLVQHRPRANGVPDAVRCVLVHEWLALAHGLRSSAVHAPHPDQMVPVEADLFGRNASEPPSGKDAG